MKLHWEAVPKASSGGLVDQWVTGEQLDGVPDFRIVRQGPTDYRMKMRSSAQWMSFETLQEAKDYAESI